MIPVVIEALLSLIKRTAFSAFFLMDRLQAWGSLGRV